MTAQPRIGKFCDPLILEFLGDGVWRLVEPFDYRLGTPDGVEYVRVPKDFLTDFASVPRGLWNLLPPIGSYGKAAVIHDFLYQFRAISQDPAISDRACTRGEADAIFKEGMEVLGVGRFTRWMVYAGVRVGGWRSWNRYRAAETDLTLP